MKTSNNSLLVIIWFIANMAGNSVEQPPTGARAEDWYAEWVQSQDNTYVKMRALELGKRISKERGRVVDREPRGWFKSFLLEQIRGKLVVDAYVARRGELTNSIWKFTFTIKISKKAVKIYIFFKHDLVKFMSY
jgi:hypothetical protein